MISHTRAIFLVFVMASGCIMFMRLLNDSFAEQERYKVLRKIGITDRVMTSYKNGMLNEDEFHELCDMIVRLNMEFTRKNETTY